MFGFSKRIVAIGAAAILAVTAVGTVAFADTAPPTPTPGTGTATTTAKTDYAQVFLGKLATALGVDQAKLQSAIKQAQSDTIDQAVANGDLAKNQADAMKQRVQNSDGVGPFGLFGGHGRGKMDRGVHTAIVDEQVVLQAVADKLGLSVADLQTQLKSGKTLASLAKDKNVQVQDLYTAAANAAKPQLDQAVKDGKLTQAQADQIFQQLQNGQYLLRGAMDGGPGPMGRSFGGRGWR